MNLEQLLSELQKIEPRITNAMLSDWLKRNEVEAADISSNRILRIAQELNSGIGALATTDSAEKITKTGRKSPAKNGRTERTPKPSSVLAKTSNEMQVFEEEVITGINRWSEHQSDRIVEAVREAPNKMIQLVDTKLQEAGSDPEHFRNIGRDYVTSIFGAL